MRRKKRLVRFTVEKNAVTLRWFEKKTVGCRPTWVDGCCFVGLQEKIFVNMLGKISIQRFSKYFINVMIYFSKYINRRV